MLNEIRKVYQIPFLKAEVDLEVENIIVLKVDLQVVQDRKEKEIEDINRQNDIIHQADRLQDLVVDLDPENLNINLKGKAEVVQDIVIDIVKKVDLVQGILDHVLVDDTNMKMIVKAIKKIVKENQKIES